MPSTCRKERKELLKQRKARSNKNFSLIEDVVGSWETFRRHDVDKKKRRDLVSKVLKKIEGRIPELAASHTASRIVQACIKYGTAEEQQRVLKEVEPHLIELSKSPYGHFVVSKLIDVSPKEKYPGKLSHLCCTLCLEANKAVETWREKDCSHKTAATASAFAASPFPPPLVPLDFYASEFNVYHTFCLCYSSDLHGLSLSPPLDRFSLQVLTTKSKTSHAQFHTICIDP